MEFEINILEGVEVSVEGNIIRVKKADKELTREFPVNQLKIEISTSVVKLSNFTENAKSKALVGTFRAHIRNMIKGVGQPFEYKLKICSAHFPMSVKQSSNEIQVQNFLGEKKPKKIKTIPNVNVKIEGQDITVTSSDIELAGIMASKLEQSTRLRKKDRRIFQDGIFIVSKAGKKV
jgi:large subunit ribosomal protein L6